MKKDKVVPNSPNAIPLRKARKRPMEVTMYLLGAFAAIATIIAGVLLSTSHRDSGIWFSWAAVMLVVTCGFCWYQDRVWKQDESAKAASEKGALPPTKEAQEKAQALIDYVRNQEWAEFNKLLKEAKEESRIPLQELQRIKSESEARSRAADGLPGFIFFCVIDIREVKAERRQYLFDFGKIEQERLSIYVSRDRIFTLCLNDAQGEPHLVQVPIGKDGVPISSRFHLGCEVGIAPSNTFLRLLVDGNEKGSLSLPFKVDLGKLDSDNGVVGADLNHANGAWFDLYMDAVFTEILTKEKRTAYLALSDKLLKDLPDKPYLRFDGDQYMRFGNARNPNNVIPGDPKRQPKWVTPNRSN